MSNWYNFRINYKNLKINIINLQKIVRGNLIRKELRKSTDKISYEIMYKRLKRYNYNILSTIEFNELISPENKNKKERNENFPSVVSENIAKFAIFKKYKIMPTWETNQGDLIINKLGYTRKLEIKAFSSNGPSSFGPTENWDSLYFVDAKDTLNMYFKVYEINLSNKSNIFRNVKLTQIETFGEIADSGKRPRGCFYTIFKPQLSEYCQLIFDGHISKLN